MKFGVIFLIFGLFENTLSYNDPHFSKNRSTIVHLFEWKWTDIALECERFLGPKGYGGVQVSPVNENLKIDSPKRPWWERYQPVSYLLITRSGNEQEFVDMVKRCNFVGVRIYVDAILNHMTSDRTETIGTGGSNSSYANFTYPSVAYDRADFNTPCTMIDPNDPIEARNCELLGLRDLDQSTEYVRTKLVSFLNKLIEMGVAGFRIDAAKHMWPSDLKIIYDRLDDLNPTHGFEANARPYIYQDITDLGGNDISRDEYTALNASITEFRAGISLGLSFKGLSTLELLRYWEDTFSLVNSAHSLVFNENQDNQREHGTGSGIVLTYKNGKQYRAAIAFLLGHPYGNPRIMSSFAFTDSDIGPPMDENENILSPIIGPDGSCNRDWICEHRWNAIYQMVEFRNVAGNSSLSYWWNDGTGQIAFTRQEKGFIAFNIENRPLGMGRFNTRLPAGTYCDIMTGGRVGDRCTGKTVVVDTDSYATIQLTPNDKENVLAIHIGKSSML